MLIGAHVPVLGDYTKMAEYASSVGCECVQIFAKNARQFKYAAPKAERIVQIKKIREDYPSLKIYSHASYLINLSGTDVDKTEKSIEAMAGELAIAAFLGLNGVNVHVGTDITKDDEAASYRCSQAIYRSFVRCEEIIWDWLEDGLLPEFDMRQDRTDCQSDSAMNRHADPINQATDVMQSSKPTLPKIPKLILENAAGAGNQFGMTATQLGMICKNASKLGISYGIHKMTKTPFEIGICIDTAHAWAAGYNISDREGWDSLLDEIDSACGLEAFCLMHANDSKFDLGTNKDRHEWVGKGYIGRDGFAYIIGQKSIDHVDVVVEVPGEIPEKDRVNIELLKSMRDKTSAYYSES